MGEQYVPNSKIEKDFLKVYDDILTLQGIKYIHTRVVKIIVNNSKINSPNSFYTTFNTGYRTTLIMGIRRQIKIRKDSLSLLGLLDNIRKNPSQITILNKTVDIGKISDDISEIESKTEKYEYIADKFLAHTDPNRINDPIYIEHDEINETLDYLTNIIEKYLSDYFSFTAFMRINIKDLQTWKDIFKVPWIEEE